jgi:ABC-2 type transport system permease protein
MRMWAVFRKTMREMKREKLMLALTLLFAPFFVALAWVVWVNWSTTFRVLILDQDRAATATPEERDAIVGTLRSMRRADGSSFLDVAEARDLAAAEDELRERRAAVLVIVPPGFRAALHAAAAAAGQGAAPSPASVTLIGDLTNPAYAVAAVLASAGVDACAQAITGRARPVTIAERAMGASGVRSDFELAVPGILVFAVILLVFLAAMMIARETEAGTIKRLQITRMTALDYLGGTSLALVLVGVAAVLVALVSAWALGYRNQGPLWTAIVIGAVTSLSIIGTGLIVACFSRTVAQAFVIANFPLGLLMFFSGTMFPMPRYELCSLAGHGVSPFDLLPTTHAVIALNKVLTLGGGIGEVWYELISLLVLSALYFLAGVWLFRRKRLRAA